MKFKHGFLLDKRNFVDARLAPAAQRMGKDSMSSERMGLFWTFLDAFMFDKAQKCIASDFQCSALHPEKQTTLLANAIARGLTSLKPEQEKCFELIKALRHCGASWTQACQSSSTQSIWKNADPEKSKITLEYGTHSALSFARAWLRELHDKKEWEYNASFLHKVFEIFLAEPQPSRNKLAIDEGIVSKLRRSQVLSMFFNVANFPNDCEN